jgi:hypothetical protein
MPSVGFCSSYHRYQYLKLRGHQESIQPSASSARAKENTVEAQTD